MVRTTRRWLCWSVCFLLLFSMNLMAQEQKITLPFVESDILLLETSLTQSVTISSAESRKVTIGIPPTLQGQILLAVYDQNSRFKKVVSVHSNGQTSVEFSFEENPLEIGSYVRAFFIGENWDPLAKASDRIAVQATQVVSELFLTNDGILSFQTDTAGANSWFNGGSLNYETMAGWNQVNVEPVRDSLNEIKLQKAGYADWASQTQANSLSGLRINEYPKRIYRQNESLDISGIVLEGTTDGNAWFGLPVKREQIQGFQSSVLGGVELTVCYGNQSVAYTARVVSSTGSTQTDAGLFSVTPSEAFQTDIRDIQLRYTAKEVFIQGSLSVSLPEGLTFRAEDLVLVPGMSSPKKISELTETAIIQNEGQTLVLNSLDVISDEIIEIQLLQRELPRLANLQIEVIADVDDTGSIFTPANKMMQSINLIPGEAMSGKLFLPIGKVAPTGGLSVQLHAVGTQDYTKEILIPEGSSEITYRFVVPQGQYKMHYIVPSFTEKRQITYYDTTGIYGVDQVEILAVNAGGFYLNVQICEYFQVSGTIRLPDGAAAVGDTWISFVGKDPLTNIITGDDGGSLLEGMNSVAYDALITPGISYLQYEFFSDSLQYVRKGYYHNSGTKPTRSEAEILNIQENKKNIDLMLLTGYLVSGKVSIPEAEATPTNDISIYISGNSTSASQGTLVIIKAGIREVNYQLVLPAGTYYFYYNIQSQHQDGSYAQRGYYSTNGTTGVYSSRTDVTVNSTINGIDLTLIKGFLVSGKVTIPEVEATPTKDISISISGNSTNASQGTLVIIKAGTREVNYQLVLPAGTYYFNYYIQSQSHDGSFAQRGYYSTIGTTGVYSSRTDVTVNSAINGIDFALIKGFLVSGKVSIPEAEATPTNDISISVFYGQPSYSFSDKTVIIKAGTREVNYQLILPAGTYYFNYSIQSQSQDGLYAQRGYYSTNGTTGVYSSRTDVTVNSTINGIDFALIKGFLVSGKVSIPEAEATPTKDISIDIIWISSNTGQANRAIIKAGTRETAYQFVISPGTYYFYYNIQTQDVPYVPLGYYSTAGTATTYSSRTEINLNSNISGVDFTLIKGYFISGRVSIPELDVTPLKDISVYISSYSSNASQGTTVIIKAGTREATYQMVLPQESYTLRFYINTQDTPFVREGYYSVNGTVPREFASSILVDKNMSNLDFVLQKKSFYGTVSIPSNIATLSENLEVRVVSESATNVSETTVTIQSGERTANFVLPMADGVNIVKYQIGANDNFITQGYYYYGGTYPNLNYAQKFNATNHISNILLTLVPAYSLTGKVSLPEGEIAGAEGITIKLTAEFLYASAPDSSVQILIGPGQSNATYELKQLWGGYRLRYDLLNNSNQYEQVGYLGDSKTVSSTNGSRVLELYQFNLSEIDFELLIKTSIQGSLSLPTSYTSNSNRIPVTIYVSGSNLRVIETEIPEGQTSVSFTSEVPVGDYEIYYDLKEVSNTWVARGYYNQNGMQPISSSNNIIHIGKEGLSNLSLELIPLTKLQGVITLPTGIVAPNSGLSVALYAMGDLTYRQLLEIPSGSNQVPYELLVSAGNYKFLLVDESASKELMPVAYYHELGMKIRPEQASEVNVSNQGLVQNLQLLPKPKISGVISLPTGLISPPQGLSILMKAYSPSAVVGVSSSNLQLVSSANLQLVSAANLQLVSSSNLVIQTVQISAGESSASYYLPVNPGEYTLSYEITTPIESLTEQGFYSSNGVTNVATEKIAVQSDDILDINIELLGKAKIKGQIILPQGIVVPDSGLSIVLYAMGDLTYRQLLEIPSGSNQVPYELLVSAGNYKLLLVDESASKELMPVAYYHELGMKIRPEQASEVNVSNQGLVQNLQLLPKPKISGVISLPTGLISPPQGLSILMKAYSPSAVVGVSSSNLQLVSSANLQLVSAANLQLVSSSNLVTQTVQISAGESSTSYILPVNPGEYTLSYEVTTPFEGLVEQGFYSSSGVTNVATERIPVQSNDISNTNLELLGKAKITGQIILPGGMLAPPEGRSVQLTAMGEKDVSISCIIPSGEASTDFLFYLDPGEYYVQYRIINDFSLIEEGYINNEGQSTKYIDEAKRIILEKVGSSNIVLQLQRPFNLTGTVKTDGLYPLPENGLDLVVRAIGQRTFVSLIHLTEDQPQADFAFTLPEDTYKIAVVVAEAQAIYYKSGYLDSGMLTSEGDQADTYMMNADLTVGVITVPTKIVNMFKTPDLSLLSEVKTLETSNVVEKVVDNPGIEEGLEKETVVDSLGQENPTIESIEEIPMEEVSAVIIESEEELLGNRNPDTGVLNEMETVETEIAEVKHVVEPTESIEKIEEPATTEDTEETVVEPEITESTEEIEENGLAEVSEEKVVEGAVEAPVVTKLIETDIVEEEISVEKKEFTDTSAVLISEVTEPGLDNSISLLSINPNTLDPIIVKLGSSTITSLILTIKLPVTDSVFTDVWVGSQKFSIQPDGTFNFPLNNLAVGTTIYEIIAIDSSANSTFGKLIIASVPDSDSFEDYLLRWDITGPVIQLEDVYTVNTKPATISFHVSDESRVTEVWVGNDKAFMGPGGLTYITFTNLQAGVNEFDVLAYDEHGNATAATLVVEYLKPSTIVLTIGSMDATKNGAAMTGMDQAPLIVNGRVFLPVRFVLSNILGGTVQWDSTTQLITSVVNGNTIKMVVGSKTSYINGNAVVLLEAPYIEPFTSRTLVPMREIMEAIGISLDWNPTTQTVTLVIPQ